MEPLQTWWATELYPSKDDENFGVAGDFEVVKAADAQATIAALQARVRELEAIKIPDDAFTYCAYCGEKSPVDEHNEDLSAHIKVCPKHPMRDVETQLTQRTAERDTARRRVDELEAREVDVVTLREDLEQRTAELERVRLLSSHNERRFEEVDKKYKELREQNRVLRCAIDEYAKAKIDFDDKRLQEDHHAWRERYNKLVEAENALLQHRQGMEG